MKQCNQWNTYDDGGNYIYYAHLLPFPQWAKFPQKVQFNGDVFAGEIFAGEVLTCNQNKCWF